MQAMGRKYLETPFYGSRRMGLAGATGDGGKPETGVAVDGTMGLRAMHQGPRTLSLG